MNDSNYLMAKQSKKQKKKTQKKIIAEVKANEASIEKSASTSANQADKSVANSTPSGPTKKLSKKVKRRLKVQAEKEERKKLLEVNQKKEKHAKKEDIKKKVKENVLKINTAASEVLNQATLPNSKFKERFEKFFPVVKLISKPFKIALKIFLVLFVLGLVGATSIYLIFGRDLPDVSNLKTIDFAETTTIYDREGNVLYKIFGEENRKYVPLNEIDPEIIHATIAIEDKKFYNHFGFDPVGIIRAQLKNLEEDSAVQGASTITQQLARNIYLSKEKTFERKIKELILSLQIEWFYDKDEILEMYLNKIPYGSNAYGIEAAANTFFGKSSKDLSLLEASILASLPKGPSKYSPYGPNKKELLGYCENGNQEELENSEGNGNESETPTDETSTPSTSEAENNNENGSTNNTTTEEALPPPDPNSTLVPPQDQKTTCESPYDKNYIWGRKDYVMGRMLEDKYITQEEFLAAWEEGLTIKFRDVRHGIQDEHFVFFVKEYLEKKYGKELVESGGLEVRTTLDPHLQKLGQDAIDQFYDVNLKKYGANNGAMVALDPKTGQVLAMVGSKDYWDESIQGQNNVVTSFRQPGSAFKPLIYAAAIENGGIGSGTRLNDYKTAFTSSKKVPNNYDGKFLGSMTIRTALGGSRNIPAIKAFYVGGDEEKILDFLDKLGFKNLREYKNEYNKILNGAWTFNYGWPLAIGSGEVRLLDLTNAYATMANQGRYIAANPILEVKDRDGNILEKFDPNYKGEQVMSPETAFIVSDMLADPYARPAGTWRNILTIPGQTVAAKTGTSDKKIGRASYPNNTLTVGYSTNLAAGFWVGNTNGKPLYNSAYSLYTTDPLWNKFFKEALKDKPKEDFPVPEGIQKVGKEYYPSFWNKKDYDKMFKRLDAPRKDCTDAERAKNPTGCKTVDQQKKDDQKKPGQTGGTTSGTPTPSTPATPIPVPEKPKIPPVENPTPNPALPIPN